PRGVEEPLLGYYSVTPLTPGGWADLLGDVGLPDTLRRLSQGVSVGESHRTVEMRCLEMLPAMAHLLTERDGPSSASVRAWRLVARVVEQSVLGGGSVPDLGRFAAAFPAAGHAVLIRDEEGEVATETAADAVAGFVDSSARALSAAVRDPRIMRAPEAHADIVDLGMLQPLLRAVAPDLGLAPPLVRLHDTLEPLRLRLEAPNDPDAGWPLHADPPDPALLKKAARIFPALARATDGLVTLGQQGVVELRLAAAALEFAGASVELPSELVEEQDLEYDGAHLDFAPGALSLGGVVRYDLRASLGGREISAEEFQALAAATQPLVRVGGEWRALKGRALARAKALAAIALHGSSMPAMTALGAALAGRYEVRGMAVEVGDPTGELEQLVTRLRSPEYVAPLEPPEAFQGELRPYQKVGLGWLTRTRELGLGALLADDMGLGKTVQVIAYLLDHGDDLSGPALIVCPTSVLGNWQRELRRFAPKLEVHIHHGPDRTRDAEELADWDV
ncbi:MAG: SNF2-related protein, partial [Gaiellales bacterium]